MKTGVPQGSVPNLYLLYISDLSALENKVFVTFADDTVLLVEDQDQEIPIRKFQRACIATIELMR